MINLYRLIYKLKKVLLILGIMINGNFVYGQIDSLNVKTSAISKKNSHRLKHLKHPDNNHINNMLYFTAIYDISINNFGLSVGELPNSKNFDHPRKIGGYGTISSNFYFPSTAKNEPTLGLINTNILKNSIISLSGGITVHLKKFNWLYLGPVLQRKQTYIEKISSNSDSGRRFLEKNNTENDIGAELGYLFTIKNLAIKLGSKYINNQILFQFGLGGSIFYK